MIGHYLLTLTAEQEDRVLTKAFEPVLATNCGRCLVMTVLNSAHVEWHAMGWGDDPLRAPGYIYEDLAVRFGTERVNAAIRNRILSNRARRALAPASRKPPQDVSQVGERLTP